MRRNFHIWAGVRRTTPATRDIAPWCPTVVIDMDLASWALPFAIHAGGPLLSRPGFHFRIGPVNIGWSKL